MQHRLNIISLHLAAIWRSSRGRRRYSGNGESKYSPRRAARNVGRRSSCHLHNPGLGALPSHVTSSLKIIKERRSQSHLNGERERKTAGGRINCHGICPHCVSSCFAGGQNQQRHWQLKRRADILLNKIFKLLVTGNLSFRN
jgi:hypothetical protein